jgi:hypothetical protein
MKYHYGSKAPYKTGFIIAFVKNHPNYSNPINGGSMFTPMPGQVPAACFLHNEKKHL